MDEPLSNLDAKLRVQMRAEIAQLQRNLGTTTIYVTHDQVEAMTMGDRVAVMREGLLQQVDDPERLYEEPANLFVAAFIGSPAMNLLEGTFEVDSAGDGSSGGSGPRVSFGEHWLVVPSSVIDSRPALRDFDGRPVVVGIRPEHLYDASLVGDRLGATPSTLRAEVELREALGSELVMHLRAGARQAITEDTKHAAETDETVVEELKRRAESGVALLVARFDTRSRCRIGDSVEVAVDTERLHFFDPETGDRIAT
jgi:multiple sugar transport system ATP-binding protein